MRLKTCYMLMMAMIVLGNISLATAQKLGRSDGATGVSSNDKVEERSKDLSDFYKVAAEQLEREAAQERKSMGTVTLGLGIANISYPDSDYFREHPEGLKPGDLTDNSYKILGEVTLSPGFLSLEGILSYEFSSTIAPNTEQEHYNLRPAGPILPTGRLSAKFHPFAKVGLGQHLDFYMGGGITGIALRYKITGRSENFSDTYKAVGPHFVAGVEWHFPLFSSEKWRWGISLDYIFADVTFDRVQRTLKNPTDRTTLKAGRNLVGASLKVHFP